MIRLQKVARILHHDLKEKFAIAAPKIYACGINPHAGEDGHLGREEIEVMEPAFAQLREERHEHYWAITCRYNFSRKVLRRC